MYWKQIRKIYKFMEFGKEYEVPDLYNVIYPEGGGPYDWQWFYGTVIFEMEYKKKIMVIPYTSSTPIKIYKRKRFQFKNGNHNR